jgi:hypothetical protein
LAAQRNALLDQIQQGEVSGNLTVEEKKRLEEQATEKGLQVLFDVRLLSCRIFHFSIQMSTHVVNKKIDHKIRDRRGTGRDMRQSIE